MTTDSDGYVCGGRLGQLVRILELALWTLVGILLVAFGIQIAGDAGRVSDLVLAAFALLFATFGIAFLALAASRDDLICRRHDYQRWDPATDEWVCQRCGHRTPVKRTRE